MEFLPHSISASIKLIKNLCLHTSFCSLCFDTSSWRYRRKQTTDRPTKSPDCFVLWSGSMMTCENHVIGFICLISTCFMTTLQTHKTGCETFCCCWKVDPGTKTPGFFGWKHGFCDTSISFPGRSFPDIHTGVLKLTLTSWLNWICNFCGPHAERLPGNFPFEVFITLLAFN